MNDSYIYFFSFVQVVAFGFVGFVVNQLRDVTQKQSNDTNDLYERISETNKDILHRLDDITKTMHAMQIDMYKSYVRKEDLDAHRTEGIARTEKQYAELLKKNEETNKRIEHLYNYGCLKWPRKECPPGEKNGFL